jgi:hypothetical protein
MSPAHLAEENPDDGEIIESLSSLFVEVCGPKSDTQTTNFRFFCLFVCLFVCLFP